jgi:hypothetical protein
MELLGLQRVCIEMKPRPSLWRMPLPSFPGQSGGRRAEADGRKSAERKMKRSGYRGYEG